MKHSLMTLALAAAAISFGADAKTVTVNQLPPLTPARPAAAATHNGMSRAPLNQDAAKGLQVFGSTFIDYNMVRNFSNYYQNEYGLEKLNTIYTKDDRFAANPSTYMIHAGAYCPDDGYYYAYRVQYYTIGITFSDSWLRVNPKDGSWEVISQLADDAHDGGPLYDLAYSPYDGEMWGLVQNVDGQLKSRVGLVNMETSELTDMVQLPDYYFAIAFDYDGNMYGIRWILTGAENNLTGTSLDQFDKNFKVVKSTEIKVNGAAYLPYYQHGLDFDYTTGDLIWAGCNTEGVQHMFHINPDNGVTTDWGGIGWNESMVGLYVPYTTASHREAPAVVTDKAFTIDASGANNVTLTWTNPSTTWNRKPMTDLQKVVIYRDEHKGKPVGVVTAAGQEGKAASFTDKGATKGVHKYYIIAVNAKGEGVESSIEAYVGHDVPGPVQNINARSVDNGKSVELSWSAPVTGDSQGWFDKNLTYTIVRLPDNVEVAKGLKATTFKDADIPEAKYYTYQITAVSADGAGTPAVSNGVLAGANLAIPFSTTFPNEMEANRFLSFDSFGTPNIFQYDFDSNVGDKSLKFLYDKASDAMLCTPPMNVKKGQEYVVEWTFSLNRFGEYYDETTHHLRVMGGTAPDKDHMTDVLKDYAGFKSTHNHQNFTLTTYFTAPVDGDYCVGLNVLVEDQNRKEDWIYVRGFSVSQRFANDMAVTGFECPVSVSAVGDNFFDVDVHNIGTNKQSAYKVQVGISRLDGVFVPFAETTDVPALEADAHATVRVIGKPAEYGLQDLAARVVLDNDEQSGNDQSELTTATINGALPFNYTATDKATEGETTMMPMYTWNSNTVCQTIYTPAMLGLPEGTSYIGGLAWEYYANEDVPNIKLQVELTTFDRDYYSENNPQYVTTGLTKVFDGTVNMEEGQNHWMCASFPDNTFKIEGNQNLVVTLRSEGPSSDRFPLHFRAFNLPDEAGNLMDDKRHTLTSRANEAITDLSSVKKYTHSELPKLHIALGAEPGSGISGTLTDAAFGMWLQGNTVMFSGDVRYAAVYDLNGRLIRTAALNGNASMTLDLNPGVYVIKARNAAGATKAMKFIAR